MAKITEQSDLTNLKDLESFTRYCSQFIQDVEGIVNGNLEFDLNILSQTKIVTFPIANVDLAIPHGLGKSEVNFIVINKETPLDVYAGVSANTKQIVYLRCNVANSPVKIVLL